LNKLSEHEILTLNQSVCEEDSSEEIIDRITEENKLPLDEVVSNKEIVRLAMQGLTEKEMVIITELFWNQKKVNELTKEMNVSKNAILKVKRNALQKMRKS
jgi:DNA-directed RNA polymerase specialized sigma subunit